MIVIALGANIASKAGPPEDTLIGALAAMAQHSLKIEKISSFYRTPAWPDPTDPPFVNAVCCIDTTQTPENLLKLMHSIEAVYGRIRSRPNGPRTLDLDLLDYHGLVTGGIPQLPHPRICERAFVLVPLAEIAPDWRHPQTAQSAHDLIATLPQADIATICKLTPQPPLPAVLAAAAIDGRRRL